MVVYYAIMDQLSSEFVLNMEDSKVEESANKLVDVIENCQRAQSIQELLRRANVALSQDEIIDELQRGMISA
jgi:spore coat polysaccharide biosynthesis protein SpsF (cytidylyltransferase family)